MYIKITAEGFGPDKGREELHVHAADSDLFRRAIWGYARLWFDSVEDQTPFGEFSAAMVRLAGPAAYTVVKDTLRGDKVKEITDDEELVADLVSHATDMLIAGKEGIRHPQLPDPDQDVVEGMVRGLLSHLRDRGL